MQLLIQVVVILVIVGVALYLLNQYVPMAPPIKTVINVIVILFVIIWLLNMVGLFSIPPIKR